MKKKPESVYLDYMDDRHWILSASDNQICDTQERYIRADLTDPRHLVDELIEILEDPTHDINNVREAIQAIRRGRE